jgi:hypothetical protein
MACALSVIHSICQIMTEQASPSPDECDRWYRQARMQIDAEQYEEAIISCDRAL